MPLIDKIKREIEKKKSVLAKWLSPSTQKKGEEILIFEEGKSTFEFEKKEESEKERYKGLIISLIDAGMYDDAIKMIEEMKEKGI
jgi:pentatricopeptide repeat protein